MLKKITVILTKIIAGVAIAGLIISNAYIIISSLNLDVYNRYAAFIEVLVIDFSIALCTAGVLALVWFPYAISNFKFFKSKGFSKLLGKLLAPVFIIGLVAIAYILSALGIKFNNKQCITYSEHNYNYFVCNIKDSIKVEAEKSHSSHKIKNKIEFSEQNMLLIYDLINSFVTNDNWKANVYSENLTDKQFVVLKSVIYNNEELLDKNCKTIKCIDYEEDGNVYSICKNNNIIEVTYDSENIKTGKKTVEKNVINFKEENMNIINNFFYDLFKYKDICYIRIKKYDLNLSDTQKSILKSIIYNSETSLNILKED